MCGIGGIYLKDRTVFDSKNLKKLWNNLEDRGKHASGIAFMWQDADKPVVRKGPQTASDFSDKIISDMGIMIQYALVHTRYSTQGSTNNNGNNHPVVRDNIIMTHNGVIFNDNEMLSELNTNPKYDVDTEALVLGIKELGIGWTANNADGSMSVAWVDSNKSEEVNLFTNGRNPLVIAELSCGSIVWASGYHHLEHYNPVAYFHAVPGVVYQLSPKGVRAKVIPGDWPTKPTVISKNYYGRVY